MLAGKHLVGAVHAIDDRERPLPDLVINAPYVLSENSHTEKWKAAHHKNRSEQAIFQRVSIGEHGNESQKRRREESQGCEYKAQAQRFVAEAGDCVHRILDAAHETELTFAADAILTVVVDDGGAVSDPCS